MWNELRAGGGVQDASLLNLIDMNTIEKVIMSVRTLFGIILVYWPNLLIFLQTLYIC